MVETQWMSHYLAQASLFGIENKSVTVNRVEASKHATFFLASSHSALHLRVETQWWSHLLYQPATYKL